MTYSFLAWLMQSIVKDMKNVRHSEEITLNGGMNVMSEMFEFEVTLKYSDCCFKRKLEKYISWTEIWVPLTLEVISLYNVKWKLK